jgi:hypothetical protein
MRKHLFQKRQKTYMVPLPRALWPIVVVVRMPVAFAKRSTVGNDTMGTVGTVYICIHFFSDTMGTVYSTHGYYRVLYSMQSKNRYL